MPVAGMLSEPHSILTQLECLRAPSRSVAPQARAQLTCSALRWCGAEAVVPHDAAGGLGSGLLGQLLLAV